MAQFDSYSAIITAVQDVSEDDSQEFLDYLPKAIGAAELRMSKEIDTIGLKQNLTLNCVVGTRTVSKPSGFKFAHDMFLYDSDTGIESRLKNVTDDYLRDYWPKPALTSKPRYYAQDYDTSYFLLGPTPDKTYEIRANVEADITPLSTSNPTNYFTIYAGEILFYATMVEMCRFMKNFNDLNNWEQAYQNGILALNNQGRRGRRDDGMSPSNPSGGQNTLKGDN